MRDNAAVIGGSRVFYRMRAFVLLWGMDWGVWGGGEGGSFWWFRCSGGGSLSWFGSPGVLGSAFLGLLVPRAGAALGMSKY